jgi:hypothetical protein
LAQVLSCGFFLRISLLLLHFIAPWGPQAKTVQFIPRLIRWLHAPPNLYILTWIPLKRWFVAYVVGHVAGESQRL